MDQTLTRLGANTVFSFGATARTYDLGSGAVLVSAPKSAGTVKITTAVATCAVSGFTMILERHANAWNKFIILHGDGTLTLNGLPTDPCRLHTGQMVVFPPHPTHCPPVLNIDISKLLNGKFVKGFKGPLPELNLILADIENQQNTPPSGGLIDPTSQDVIDQSINGRPPQSPPTPVADWSSRRRDQAALVCGSAARPAAARERRCVLPLPRLRHRPAPAGARSLRSVRLIRPFSSVRAGLGT